MRANINWVTPSLATGGDFVFDPDDAMAQIADILDQGITRIVDLRSEADDRYVWENFPEVTYVHAPADDPDPTHGEYHMPKAVFDVAVAMWRNVTAATGKMLVHCHMGINRGPSAAMAVLLDMGHDPVEAFDMVRAARPEAAVFYAMDALCADQQRRGVHHEPWAKIARDTLAQHMDEVFTPEEQRRIAHIIRDKHDFDLRSLFA